MVASCPGFANYEPLKSGEVVVNGLVPMYALPDRVDPLLTAWGRYGGALQAAANKYQLPVAWLVGIMMAESKGNAVACSPCEICKESLCEEGGGMKCCAFGLMQFIGPTARAYGTTPDELMRNPAMAIDAAAQLIVKLQKTHGFDIVRIAAAYNGGINSCGKAGTTFGWHTNADYPMTVVQYANTFVSLKLAPVKGFDGWGMLLTAAGVVTAAAIYTGKLRFL